mmetsp:Transcript_6766/g.16508  ORF Transcript_6766/g.16508 Transcript_6766/m.16508 type:complete len:96 (-) Transcript_6766:126-413(-)
MVPIPTNENKKMTLHFFIDAQSYFLSRFLSFAYLHENTKTRLEIDPATNPFGRILLDFFPVVPGRLHCSQPNKIDTDLPSRKRKISARRQDTTVE